MIHKEFFSPFLPAVAGSIQWKKNPFRGIWYFSLEKKAGRPASRPLYHNNFDFPIKKPYIVRSLFQLTGNLHGAGKET